MTIYSPDILLSQFESVNFSISSSNYCFLTCARVSQETGKMVWYSHLLKNFPWFVVIHTVKGFGVVSEADIDVFSWILLLFLWSNGCWWFDGNFGMVIKVKWGYMSGALIQPHGVFIQRTRDTRDQFLSTHVHRGKTRWGHSKKEAVYKPRREISWETSPKSTLILDVLPPELWEN